MEKTEKLKPFFEKHCKQGGALPQADTLRCVYIPKAFDEHLHALKAVLKGEKVSVTADETTDCRDHSVLNVIAGSRGKSYLIDVVIMEKCNHSTLSQAIIRSVSDMGIHYDDVTAIVTDSAAYCKKAYRDVLSAVFPKSLHVLCMAHIINLAGEMFTNSALLDNVSQLNKMVKSAFFKKPGCKQRYITFLGEYLPADEVRLPPALVSTRWNSWFEAAKYHAHHMHLYEGFFIQEKSDAMAVDRILELTTNNQQNKDDFNNLRINLNFVEENSNRLISSLKCLEETPSPLATRVYNVIEDLRLYLTAGTKKTNFGPNTDALLKDLNPHEQKMVAASFNKLFEKSLEKLSKHIDSHPVYALYKALRLFDPRQLPTLSHDIKDYSAISELANPSAALLDEFLIYVHFKGEEIPTPFTVSSFWKANTNRFPHLASVASTAIWMPVASVDVERSFSIYKHILNDRREKLTPENTKYLSMMYFNGDLEQRFPSADI